MPNYKTIHMMKIILLMLATCISFLAFSQDTTVLFNFENDFLKAANSDIKEKELKKIIDKYEDLFFIEFDESETKYLPPLINFKKTSAYKNNIEKLLFSNQAMGRILAYKTLSSTADTTYNSVLLDRLKSDTFNIETQLVAMCLFYNNSKTTDELFDFVIKNDDFTDQLFFRFYCRLDTSNLKLTSWKNLSVENKYSDDSLNLNMKAKIYSVQILAYLDKSAEADSLIIQSIKTWDKDYKGYAIASLFQRDNLEKFEILKPYLDNETTRNISIKVLEKSKFQSDKDKIEKLKKKKKWD